DNRPAAIIQDARAGDPSRFEAEDRVTRLVGLNDLVAFPEAPTVIGHRRDQERVASAQRVQKFRSMQREIGCGGGHHDPSLERAPIRTGGAVAPPVSAKGGLLNVPHLSRAYSSVTVR